MHRASRRIISKLKIVGPEIFQVDVVAPPTAEIAPRGYHLSIAVHRGVPSQRHLDASCMS